MSGSIKFLCQTCGARLDYPPNFKGQTVVCNECGLNTILKDINLPQGGADSQVPTKLQPASPEPSPAPEVPTRKNPKQEADNQETITQENVPLAMEPEALEKPSPAPEVPTRKNPNQEADNQETITQENIPLATEPEALEKPPKVKAICVFHCIAGPVNILLGLFFLIIGILLLFSGGKSIFAFLTKLGGPLLMVMGVLVMAIGAFEAISAFKHFGENARPKYKFVKLVAILEIVSILGGACHSFVFGIIILIFLADQRVKEYYD